MWMRFNSFRLYFALCRHKMACHYYSIILVAIFLLLSGCTTFSGSYPNQMTEIKKNLQQGNAKAAEQDFLANINPKSYGNLYLLGQGRLAQLNRQIKQAKDNYAAVINTVATSKMAAKIQISKVLDNIAAMLTNDLSLPFMVPDYAMTFLYAYQALNYLSENNLSDALVTIRQLSNAQFWVYQQKLLADNLTTTYQKDLNVAEIPKQKPDISQQPELKEMFTATQEIENAYENGFAYYLASILYQAFDNNYNNAFVAIKSSKRLLPNNPYVEQTYQEIKRGFNGDKPYEKNNGRLVILYEQGFVAPKSAFKLPIFLGKLGLQEITVPYYSSDYPLLPEANIKIHQNNQVIQEGKTAILVDTTKMAMKSLTEKYYAIIAREVIRLVVKSLATLKASNELGGWGTLFGSIYSVVTAKADQRSWLLLPNNIALYETQLKSGTYELTINNRSHAMTIASNQTTVLWLVTMGEFHQAYHILLE